jgi:DNA-binding transcriptional regulator GbsR (MarR family)
MKKTHEDAISEFVERLGLIAQADGIPRIAGRIMGLLVIHGGPFSFAELAEQLEVSRGSISTNTRLLEHLGIIERVAKRGERQDFFQIRSEPYIELMRGHLGRMHKAAEVVAEAQSKLPDDWKEPQKRLTELRDFYRTMIERIEPMVSPKIGDKRGGAAFPSEADRQHARSKSQ